MVNQVPLPEKKERVDQKDQADAQDIAEHEAHEQGQGLSVEADAADFEQGEFDEPRAKDRKDLTL